MTKQRLLEPINVSDLALTNRIVMAPMGRSRADHALGIVGDLQVTYYGQRASAGLIVTEGALVSTEATGGINLPGIFNQEQIAAWESVTKAVHSKGGRIFLQLWHTGRLSHPLYQAGQPPLAPSAINPEAQVYTPNGFEDTVVPREMSADDIKRTIGDFTQAARNALQAGFDGVELQAGNGYLLHQFFSLYANQRTDSYGGSIKNRARILFDLLEQLKKVIPINRVGIRLNPSQHNILGMMLDKESIQVHEYIINKLNDYNIAYLHLIEPYTPVEDHPFGISRIARHFRPIYKGLLIANGGYTPQTAEAAIDRGEADIISFGKAFIANPDLVERIQNGWPLNADDASNYYSGGAKGYIDYPTYQDGIQLNRQVSQALL